MGDTEERSASPPLPKGSYNLNFEDFDENVNPFATKTKVSQSPPRSFGISKNNGDAREITSVKSKSQHSSIPGSKKQSGTVSHSPPYSPEDAVITNNNKPAMPQEDQSPENPPRKKIPTKKVMKKSTAKSPASKTERMQDNGDNIQIHAPKKLAPIRVGGGGADLGSRMSGLSMTAGSDGGPMAVDRDYHHAIRDAVHEFGSEDNADMPEEGNEGFAPVIDDFKDPATWEMLENLQGHDNFKDSDLTQMKGTAASAGSTKIKNNTSNIDSNAPSGKAKVDKHPATRALEQRLEQGDRKPVQKEQFYSPIDEQERYYDARDYPVATGNTRRTQGDVSVDGARMSTEGSTEAVVQFVQEKTSCPGAPQVLKYSQTEWNKLKQELEVDFQTRILQKEKEWSKKLGDRDKKISQLNEDFRKLKLSNDDMRNIVAEFERTISQLQDEREKNESMSKGSISNLVHERDQAVEDLQGVEAAFSDLHRRYEKLKLVVEGFKKNEETLKSCVDDYQIKLKKAEEKIYAIKEQAEEKLDQANTEIERLQVTTYADITKLESSIKKKELQVQSLERRLEQKVQENLELTSICDELISKVGASDS